MKKKINQSTGSKIFNGITMALIFVCLFAFTLLISSNITLQRAYEKHDNLVDNASLFMNTSSFLTNESQNYTVTGDIEHYNNYWNEVNELKNREKAVGIMRDEGLNKDEDALINEMFRLSNYLVPIEERAMIMVNNGNLEGAREILFGDEYLVITAQIKSLQLELIEKVDERTTLNLNSAKSNSKYMSIFMFMCLGLILLIQNNVIYYTGSNIINPLIRIKDEMKKLSKGNLHSEFDMTPDTSEIGNLVDTIQTTKSSVSTYISDISEKMESIADGDLTHKVTMEYVGDYAPIRESMNKFIYSLNQILREIKISSDQINIASSEISNISQSLATGSNEQSATLNEVEAMAENVDKIAKNNYDITKEAIIQNRGAGKVIEESISQIEKMVDAMSKIKSDSEKISNVIKLIDDIAFQTNILSLNAAVEAARAGSAGKGFSVVADEVRNLSQKTANAAKETEDLILNSNESIEAGSAVVNDLKKVIDMVSYTFNENIDQIQLIDEASSRQVESVEQITTGINHLTDVVTKNSATAEETSVSAQQMYSQAESLKSIVDKFRLKDEEDN